MANHPDRRSAGELAAYQLGLQLGVYESKSTHRRRREVHITEDSVTLIEEEIYTEERFH